MDTMLFMDWRDDHTRGTPGMQESNAALPTFLYAMPFRWVGGCAGGGGVWRVCVCVSGGEGWGGSRCTCAGEWDESV